MNGQGRHDKLQVLGETIEQVSLCESTIVFFSTCVVVDLLVIVILINRALVR